MRTERIHYTRKAVADAFGAVGVRRGDILFSHSNLAYFGLPEGGLSEENLRGLFLDMLLDHIGSEGTLVVPTFTYSFTKKEIFDPLETPSLCGVFTEMVRRHPASHRSHDPVFSVAAIGAQARELTDAVSEECFGKDSFWDRFYQKNGRILNFNFGVPVTFFHYVERMLNVPYRYDKRFYGLKRINSAVEKASVVYFCHDLSNNSTRCNWMGIDALARQRQLSCEAKIGRGYITLADARELYGLIRETMKTQPFFLTDLCNDPVSPVLFRAPKVFSVAAEKHEEPVDLVASFRLIPRDMVSDGYDACLDALRGRFPIRIHEYLTGSNFQGWIVPEKWTCEAGHVVDKRGKKLCSYDADLRCIATYSKSFEGKVDREGLFRHLFMCPSEPSLYPAPFIYYHLDWGICCGQDQLKERFSDDEYQVLIRSVLSYGKLAVGEMVIPGTTEGAIVIVSRLGSRQYADDGLCGVATMLELYKELNQHTNRHTYYFLIVPQDFCVMAYFESNPIFMEHIRCAVFLDNLSGNVHGYGIHCSSGQNDFKQTLETGIGKALYSLRDGYTLQRQEGDGPISFDTRGIPLFSVSREGAKASATWSLSSVRENCRLLLHLLSQWESL